MQLEYFDTSKWQSVATEEYVDNKLICFDEAMWDLLNDNTIVVWQTFSVQNIRTAWDLLNDNTEVVWQQL
jgi:hypothetical protein